MTSDLTTQARAGYDGNPNPHIYSAPSWYAHALGSYLHTTGRAAPRDVRMSRGDSIRVNDMRFTFKGSADAGVTFTRVE